LWFDELNGPATTAEAQLASAMAQAR